MLRRTLRPSTQPSSLSFCLNAVRAHTHEDADVSQPLRLLRVRRAWPHRRAAEQRDELAASHSITSSAMASMPGGIVRPSVLAVLRLMTKSNLVGICTGRSAGLSPL